jgi:hypothetical protein
MKEYQARNQTDAVVRLSDGMIVGPEHEEEWAEYQSWLAEGNTPDDPEPYDEGLIVLTPEEKLAKAGLSVDELKHLLGL